MQQNIKKNVDQKSIITEQDKKNCLDTISLTKLEQSYRDWLQLASRSDVRLSRTRILLLFLLIRYTGAKLNEILSLNLFQDVDLSDCHISIRDHHSKETPILRTIPISHSLADEIKLMLADPVFSTSIKPKFSIDPGFVRRKFYERSKSCGFDKKLGGPEMIRKARAVELLKNNIPMPAVQSILGHSTPNLTKSMVSFSEIEIQRITQLFMEGESDRKTSARNSFFGKIKVIEQGDILTRLEMITIDGFSVTATITTGSVSHLGLKQNRLITAEVKAPWVVLQRIINSKTISCTAENQFDGNLTQINIGDINTEYIVRISDVTELCAIVTTESYRQLSLKTGDRIRALFNSFAVVLHAG